jgi:hypothetical protein
MDDGTLTRFSEQDVVAALEWREATDTGAAILAKYKEANRAVLPLSR